MENLLFLQHAWVIYIYNPDFKFATQTLSFATQIHFKVQKCLRI